LWWNLDPFVVPYDCNRSIIINNNYNINDYRQNNVNNNFLFFLFFRLGFTCYDFFVFFLLFFVFFLFLILPCYG